MRILESRALVSGTYAAVRYNADTESHLNNWCKINGIIPPLEYHTTVIYSRHPVPYVPTNAKGQVARVIGFDVFGLPGSTRTLVMLLRSDFLVKRFADAKHLGAVSDYPTYRPHVSLGPVQAGFDTKGLRKPRFPLVMQLEYTEDLRDS